MGHRRAGHVRGVRGRKVDDSDEFGLRLTTTPVPAAYGVGAPIGAGGQGPGAEVSLFLRPSLSSAWFTERHVLIGLSGNFELFSSTTALSMVERQLR